VRGEDGRDLVGDKGGWYRRRRWQGNKDIVK